MARIIEAFSQFFDDNGDPLVNGWLKFNESGTNNTDKTTYADINESIPNTNPLQLDGAGRCPNVFGPGAYNVISFADDVVNPGQPGQQIQQFDPVGGTNGEGDFSDWAATEIYSIGDIVTASNGRYYRSLSNDNENNEPSSSPTQWEEITFNRIWNENVTYDITDTVYASDGLIYISRIGGNIGNNPIIDFTNWRLLDDAPDLLNNVSFIANVAAKSLTFNLKTNAGLDPNTGDKVIASFISATLTDSGYEIVSATSSLSISVPSGATLGFDNSETNFIYLYLVNNAGALELGISKANFDKNTLQTTVAIDATSDLPNVLYTSAARTDVAIRLIGRIKIETGLIAGEWDNAPTELISGDFIVESQLFHVQEQQPSGTNAGGSAAGNNTRVINTVLTNEIAGASLASNQITLPPGKYYIEAEAPCYAGDEHMLRIYDTTAAAFITEVDGQNTFSGNAAADQDYAKASGRFTLSVESVLELRHQIKTPSSLNGLGRGTGTSITIDHETYTDCKVWKVNL